MPVSLPAPAATDPVAAALALASSLSWGAADFLGGERSRRWGVLRVLAWSQLAALALVWLAIGVGTVGFGLEIRPRDLAVAAVGGVAGVVALAAFYRALAIGPMAVVPPIAAAGVVVPVSVGFARGGEPTPAAWLGLALATAGVVAASIGSTAAGSTGGRRRIQPATLGLCLVAACGFAIVFVAIDSAAGSAAGSALVATGGVRLGSAAMLAVVILASRARIRAGVGARTAAGFAAIGVLDTGANLLFALATAYGRLEVVAVLASLYPAVTSAMAHVLLGERLGRLQLVGVVVALSGVAVLAQR